MRLHVVSPPPLPRVLVFFTIKRSSLKNANGGVYGGAVGAMNTLPLPMDPAAFANAGGMFNPYAAAAMAQQQAMMMQQVPVGRRGGERESERGRDGGEMKSLRK